MVAGFLRHIQNHSFDVDFFAENYSQSLILGTNFNYKGVIF